MRASTPFRQGPPQLLEEYRRIRLIGTGGMGQVYLYQDMELDRLVAIKFLHRLEEGFGKRFRTEALAAAKIQHPNVVTIHRVSEIEGRPYLVYEYIRGTSLDELARPIAWRRAHEIGLDLARGLAAAHRCGVLHRDIKPGNAILVSETGAAKLIDFGLAKLVSATGPIVEAWRGDHANGAAVPPEAPEAAPVGHEEGMGGMPVPTAVPVTVSDDVWGTLPYTAPEVLQGEAATQRADVYALGVVLYELCTGWLPDGERLARGDAPQDDGLLHVDAGFAAVIRRCLDPDPARRYRDGEALRRALEALGRAEQGADVPVGNPYRGLLCFESRHRALFFGRGADSRDVIERLHAQRFVLLTGESGVGKSSLARAGVLPLIEEGALAQGRAWSTLILEPGRWPLTALLQLLATRLGAHEDALRADGLAGDMAAIAARVRQRHGDASGTVLFIDQLEELVTWSDPQEAAATATLVATLVERVRGMRILATARTDQLARLAALPGLVDLLERNLVLVRPLGKEAVRETIVGPARLTGVRFESDELVDELVDSAVNAEGGLPLLQFALAELWKDRDAARNLITRAAFDRLDGVAGALSQHADGVLAGWERDRLDSARRILLRLVTSHRTRARCTREELIGAEPGRAEVLDRLVGGRLVVVSTSDGQAVYALAHEALLRSWTTLRHWLDEGDGAKAVLERLGHAAGEWERTGRAGVGLWGATQLAEAQIVDPADLAEREAAFLAASRRAVRRRKQRLWLTAVVVALGLAMAGGGVRYLESRRLAEKIAEHVGKAEQALRAAESQHECFRQKRANRDTELRKDPRVDAPARTAAEALWKEALGCAGGAKESYFEASLELEIALKLDPSSATVSTRLAGVLDDLAHLANEEGRTSDRDALLKRLAVYDRARRKHWAAPVVLDVHTTPSGARVTIERSAHAVDGCLENKSESNGAVLTTPFQQQLSPGSYVFIVHEDETHVGVRYPFFVPCAQVPGYAGTVTIARPPRESVPEGFAFIPPGRFLFGYGANSQEEPLRAWYGALPLHERETGSYLIARHEVTFSQYIEYLDACFPDRCPGYRPHLPRVEADMSGGINLELRPFPGNDWELVMGWPGTGIERRARRGQPIVYPDRARRQVHAWEQFPVVGLSREDAQSFIQWLRDTGRIPGARLCREDEWERAARGADGRSFPHGSELAVDDANYDETYGRRKLGFGPDAVGSHERSVSSFGLHDMAGNVWEIVDPIFDRSQAVSSPPLDALGHAVEDGSMIVVRSGSYYHHGVDSMTFNSTLLVRGHRDSKVGLRLCADVAP